MTFPAIGYQLLEIIKLEANRPLLLLLDPEYEGEDERITPEGLVKLFEDLNIDPEDVRPLFL